MKEGGFPTILWMLLFCNVVDTDDASAASNKGPKTMVSSISEMLKSRKMLNGSVRCTATVEKEERSSYPNILASLEQCFRALSHGRNLIEMIDCVTSCKSAQDHTKHRDGARLSMGKICRDLIHLIEMEPNVPYATWLVYYYELYRAEEHMVQYTMYMEILVSLIVCLRVHAAFKTSGDPVSTMRQLQVLIDNIKELYGYDLLHLVQDGKSVMDNIETYVRSTADRLGIKLDCTQMMDDVRMLINNVIQKFSGIALNMFHDAYDKVYTIPTAIEPPAPIPVSSEKKEGKSQWPSTPMIEGTMWNDSGWFIVSLSCELYIVKVIKICVDWESWWSMDFVSRRDCKTVFHGFVYRQVTVDTEDDHEEADELPCVLLRKGGLVLFHPCDIVSRLYVIKVMRHEHTISSRYYSFDMFTGARTLYVMPGFEVKRYTQFRRTAARLSKYLNPSMIDPEVSSGSRLLPLWRYYSVPGILGRRLQDVTAKAKESTIHPLLQEICGILQANAGGIEKRPPKHSELLYINTGINVVFTISTCFVSQDTFVRHDLLHVRDAYKGAQSHYEQLHN